MSRLKDNYENSRWRRFERWVDGETDPLAHGMEVVAPKENEHPDNLESLELQNFRNVPNFPNVQNPQNTRDALQASPVSRDERRRRMEEHVLHTYRKLYQWMSVILCAAICTVLLWTITYLPQIGNAGNPDNNEVSARYIEQGLKETGAVNIVTGMILDYRAFDTFGESCVLFIASCCVLVLLRSDRKVSDRKTDLMKAGEPDLTEAEENDRIFEPKNDIILQKCACILVPVIFIFGIYIVLNGHLSPGGGFSGGAVLGSGLILYLNAFGFARMERLFTEKVYCRVTLCALMFYCLAKSYSFFTGANHLESGIPLGTPGNILSSGLILPLNICVGLVVACTMYAFYALFRKGGM